MALGRPLVLLASWLLLGLPAVAYQVPVGDTGMSLFPPPQLALTFTKISPARYVVECGEALQRI